MVDLKGLSSNWKNLQASGKLEASGTFKSQKIPKQDGDLKRKSNSAVESHPHSHRQHIKKKARKMSDGQAKVISLGIQQAGEVQEVQFPGDRVNEGLAKNADIGKYLAIDCEMVGVGPNPQSESALARVSLVNYNGEQVYDSYVKPQEEVTDWRTHVSGIQPKHMTYARSFEEAQADIASLIKGRVIIGHSVRSDFEALFLDHPKRDIRDTAKHPPYRKLAGGGSPKLKILVSELLGLDIQIGEHSSIEDARATMLLFRRDKDAFEHEHVKKWGPAVNIRNTGGEVATANGSKKPKKKKKKKR